MGVFGGIKSFFRHGVKLPLKQEVESPLRTMPIVIILVYILLGLKLEPLLFPRKLIADDSSGFVVIRDAETEEVLNEVARKIFEVGGLNKKHAKAYVVLSNSINAFTIGNGYIFITSGMLLKLKNPLHLIAVLCHEVAHLSARHIDTLVYRLQTSNSNFLLAILAGIAGTIASGSADTLAILLGYRMTAERLLLRFSRDQEFAADALGASFLERLGYSSQALVEVFEEFDRLEIMGGASGLPVYIRTHPKSIDRISALKKSLKTQNKKRTVTRLRTKCDLELLKKYSRIVTKIGAFIKGRSPFQTLPKEDYARAIYLHRKGLSREAIDILKKLISKDHYDIFYKEALAQILSDIGQISEALQYYEQIYSPKIHPLIKVEYAKVLIQLKRPGTAIKILENAKYEDQFNPEIFRLLGNAYGQQHRYGVSFFMLAQEQMLLQNFHRALALLRVCVKRLDRNKEAAYLKKATYFIELINREIKAGD